MLNLSTLRNTIVGQLRTATSNLTTLTSLAPTSTTPRSRAIALPSALLVRLRPWRTVILQAAGMWLATRLVLIVFTYFAVLFQHSGRVAGYFTIAPHAMLAAWQQWDAQWYIQIASTGYFKEQAAAFFPLYPALIKFTTLLIGQHWLAAALLVSNFGALLGFIGIGLLAVGEDQRASTTWSTIRVMAAYPLAFYLAAPYTEGFFLGFACLCLFCARRGSWRWCALWALLAGLTRPTGVVLMPAILWEYGRQHGWWTVVGQWLRRGLAWARVAKDDPRGEGRKALALLTERQAVWREQWHGRWHEAIPPRAEALNLVLALGAVPAALASFMVVLQIRFGHPLLWYNVQRLYWRRESMSVWDSLAGALHQTWSMPDWSYWQARQLVDLAPVLIVLVLVIVTVRRMPVAFTLYTLALVFLAISTPVPNNPDPDYLMSAGRFLIAAAPIFLLLGRWAARRPWLDLLLVSGGFMLQAVLLIFYLNGGWIL